MALYVATTQQSLKGMIMEFFIILVVSIIAVWVWIERDNF